MLAARNGIYGLSLAPVLTGSRVARLLQSHLVIDESTAMARAQDSPERARTAFLFTGLSVLLCWNAGTLAGALAGGGHRRPARPRHGRDVPRRLPRAAEPAAAPAGRPARGRHRRADRRRAGTVTPPGIPIVAAIGALVPAGLAARRMVAPRELGRDPRARGGVLRAEGARDGAGRRPRDPPAGARAARPGARPAARRADPDPDGQPPPARTRSTRGCPRSASPALLVWRRAPFLVVVLAAAATAALLRARLAADQRTSTAAG